jgi:hypothetical protein
MAKQDMVEVEEIYPKGGIPHLIVLMQLPEQAQAMAVAVDIFLARLQVEHPVLL